MAPAGGKSDPRKRRIEPKIWVLLLLVSALAFGLRFGAVSRLLPVRPEPDSDMVWMYRSMAGEDIPTADFYFGRYPVLWPSVLAVLASPKSLEPAATGDSLEAHLAAARAPWVHMRTLMALLATLTVPLSFFLARRWMSDGWALLVAALLASALLHVAHSSVSKAHAAHVTMAWLTILLALRQLDAASVGRVLATTLAAVLAIGTFHTGFFVLLPMVAAAWLARPSSRAAFWAAWIAVPVACFAGLKFTPGGLSLGSDVQLSGSIHAGGIKLGRGHALLLEFLNGSGIRKWPHFFWEYDPLLAILATLGVLLMLRCIPNAWRDLPLRRSALLVAAYAVPYLVLISLDLNVADRYLLPLYPLFAILAAHAARKTLGALPGAAPKVLACLALLALPTYVAARYTWLGRQPDTFDQLATWMEAQPAASSKKILLAPPITPRLFPTATALTKQLAESTGRSQPWFAYLGRLPALPTSAAAYDLAPLAPEFYRGALPATPDLLASYLERERPDWVVLDISKHILGVRVTRPVYAMIRERGTLVATFSGEAASRAGEFPFDYQGARHLAERVLSAAAFGPRLEVYGFKWE